MKDYRVGREMFIDASPNDAAARRASAISALGCPGARAGKWNCARVEKGARFGEDSKHIPELVLNSELTSPEART